MKALFRAVPALVVVMLLTGCETPETVQPDVVAGEPEPVAEVYPVVEQPAGPSDAVRRQMILADMLYAARMAVEDNRLMAPSRNSAYEQYRAILDFDPENPQALQGIKDIAQRYVELAQGAIAIGQYDEAGAYLRQAGQLDEGSSALAAARQELQQARSNETEYYPLSAQAVSSRSLDLMIELGDIAEEISSRDARFLITARSDEEGRWIYQTMREALGGQRLRGNIAIGNQPGIQLTIPVID